MLVAIINHLLNKMFYSEQFLLLFLLHLVTNLAIIHAQRFLKNLKTKMPVKTPADAKKKELETVRLKIAKLTTYLTY